MDIEKRKLTFPLDDIEFEKREDGSLPTIKGHAAVFNVIEDGGWFREQVAPGAFSESLKTDDIRALWNHNTEIVIGRNKNGTLRLKEDKKGLYIEIDPPNTSAAKDAVELIRRGDVSQMSFGFQVKKATWREEEDEKDLRTIEEVKLWEVSPVTFPFYDATDISIKSSHAEWRSSLSSGNKPVKPRFKYQNIPKVRRLLNLKFNRSNYHEKTK